MASAQATFWAVMAVVVLVGGPLSLAWTAFDYFRGKGSERQGTGSQSFGVALAMQELDRLMARPSIEHKLETENQVQQRDDDSGGD